MWWIALLIVLVLILIALVLVGMRGESRSLVDSSGVPGTGVPSDERAIELARAGRKIDAIKMVRELHGIGLREAKDWVESLDGRGPRPLPLSVPQQADDGPVVDPAADAEVSRAIEMAVGGKKVQAIKLVRQARGLGLQEAKEFVEAEVRRRTGR